MKQFHDTAVCIFAYIRDDSLFKLLEDIKKNTDYKKYNYYFFVDHSKSKKDYSKHLSVLKIINKFKFGLKVKLIVRKKNIGLSKNILKGINLIKKNYKKFIVLEDDLRISKHYFQFMQQNLNQYQYNQNILTISGYIFPKKIFKINLGKNNMFLSKRPNTWGWGSWSSKWNKINFKNKVYEKILKNKYQLKYISEYGNDLKFILRDTLNNKIDSWAIKWTIHHILEKKLCIFPSRTLVNEEGFYYKPTNNRLKTNKFNHSKISNFQLKNYSKLILENKEIMQSFKKIYDFPVYKLMIKKIL